MPNSHAIVVGAGLGGLATAIYLRLQGREVTVLERMPRVGGRCNVWESEGFHFDMGPSLLMMIPQLNALFEAADRRLEDYLTLVPLDPNYRVHFADGETFAPSARREALLAEVERLEVGAGAQMARFLDQTDPLFEVGMRDFVQRPFPRVLGFVNPKKLGFFLRGQVLGPLHGLIGRYFRDERLRNALAFPALYLGLSPYDAPAIYSLLTYAELSGGLHFPLGGMGAIPAALARLAEELGVELRCGVDVTGLQRNEKRVTGVMTADGHTLEADLVVVNGDLPHAYPALLGEPHPRAERFAYSCGAFLMFLGTSRRYPQLLHHQFVLPGDLEAHMRDVFETPRISPDPAFYLCNANKTDPALAPASGENLFVLVPVPHEAPGIDWQVEGPRLRDQMLDRLEAFGLEGLRDHLVTERVMTPADMRLSFGLARGAAFGLSHQLRHVGPLRPRNRHHRLRNLYFVGASTHPGSGIPMVLISGQLAAQRIAKEQPLAIDGGPL